MTRRPGRGGQGGEDAVPARIQALADARALARAGRDWVEADRLRGEIEAAGWRVVDSGFSYRLLPAHPPDVDVGGIVRYGRSASVPSRLDEPSTSAATVIVVGSDDPDDLARTLAGLRAHAPAGTQIVVVADEPSAEQDAALATLEAGSTGEGPSLEVVRTSARTGYGAALNMGLRRASGSAVIVLGEGTEPRGDIVTPLLRVLDDPGIAVAGARGLTSIDMRHFVAAVPTGVEATTTTGIVAVEADAIEGTCMAFRRSDAAARGPVDERFTSVRRLDIWWSLVLRDAGEGAVPRRAVALPELPLALAAAVREGEAPLAPTDRLARRDHYRILDRFGRRRDLLRSGPSDEEEARA